MSAPSFLGDPADDFLIDQWRKLNAISEQLADIGDAAANRMCDPPTRTAALLCMRRELATVERARADGRFRQGEQAQGGRMTIASAKDGMGWVNVNLATAQSVAMAMASRVEDIASDVDLGADPFFAASAARLQARLQAAIEMLEAATDEACGVCDRIDEIEIENSNNN